MIGYLHYRKDTICGYRTDGQYREDRHEELLMTTEPNGRRDVLHPETWCECHITDGLIDRLIREGLLTTCITVTREPMHISRSGWDDLRPVLIEYDGMGDFRRVETT